MYFRIMNQLDAKVLKNEIIELTEENGKEEVANRIEQLTKILDEAYGGRRTQLDMGGYVLFFPDETTFRKYSSEILSFYNLQSTISEYKELIQTTEKSKFEWYEELYIAGTENSLVLVYPVVKDGVDG